MSEVKPSDEALSFEAVKVAMTQDKNGVILKLSIHPHQVPGELHSDWVGTRYVVALVKVNDDETVEKRVAGKSATAALVATAGMLCRNERFCQWLVSMKIAPSAEEADVTEALHQYLLIKSRKELADDVDAARKFLALKRSFELDVESGVA